jgi:DmsE family decaheme c-type cytochrome
MVSAVIALALSALVFLLGCDSLKSSRPILMQKEYERMVVGRFDADYVGTETCLKACHYHYQVRKDFEASTMGAQMEPSTGMPLLDCESCHGPGSLAIEGITVETVKADAAQGKQTECKYDTLIDLKDLPAQAASLICLKCHTANATFNLHNWNAGLHAQGGVSCSDCHNIHEGPDLIVRHSKTYDMCTTCHEEKKAEFSLPSRHPVKEGKVLCTDCHSPHGTSNDRLLRQSSVKATCSKCHADKEGPFVYGHAGATDDCTNCHQPHGSVNNNLLTASEPFICLQCHSPSHSADATSYTRCTDCHSQIHGSDVPGFSDEGNFTR